MKENLQFKNFKVESYKSDDEGRLLVCGWGSSFGNVDSSGEAIQFGSYTKTLQERENRIAFCYQHNLDQPIGKLQTIKELPEGLWVESLISASEQSIQTKIKEGILQEMSIGYKEVNSTRGEIEGIPCKIITEIKLYEVSIVTIAANPLAVITGMKSEEAKDYFGNAFERLIAGERSEQRKFELMKLKSQIDALIQQQPDKVTHQDTAKREPLQKNEILKLLLNQN